MTKEYRARYHGLARAICAAWLANHMGLSPGHALKQVTTDPEKLAPIWFELAQVVDDCASKKLASLAELLPEPPKTAA